MLIFLIFLICAFSMLVGLIDSVVGARLAIAKGSRFVRIFFLVIVCALIAKLAQSIFAP